MTSSNNIHIEYTTKSKSTDKFTISKANSDDTSKIVSFLQFFKEISFCDWQDEEHIRNVLHSDSSRCYLAKKNNHTIIGVIIGGFMGTRATLNHIAVSPLFRNNKIGTALTKAMLSDFYDNGIKRVFLFIDNKNKTAYKFWSSFGFLPTVGETTCELDL
ncbi:GNAT family N-acetyltransferase [Entomobacter blattae]|uniref:Acetyltransferase (GNAT) family protein n=1 Tax=Entomobacter blattae TaxID=2762277 RepID=A0A7H1NRJ8_9PROT|nr:GNAT family N-acetyltransferase [Entomobacter blattae]QNT78408.1 Acetyltransferase (GNAT) family protein [Entomobacter blattae]